MCGPGQLVTAGAVSGFHGQWMFDIEALRALRSPDDTAESYADKVRANGVQCHIDHQPNGSHGEDGQPVIQTDVWVRHNGLWESIAVFLPDGSGDSSGEA